MWYVAGEEWKEEGKAQAAWLPPPRLRIVFIVSVFLSSDFFFSEMLTFNFNIGFALEVYFSGFDTPLNVALSSPTREKEDVEYYAQV